MKYCVQVIIVAIVCALLTFCVLDTFLGTTEKSTEAVTVTDTYYRHIKSGNSIITKYYVTIETENGAETISITHTLYDNVEINNEIEVVKTVTQTKWTNETVISYSIN